MARPVTAVVAGCAWLLLAMPGCAPKAAGPEPATSPSAPELAALLTLIPEVAPGQPGCTLVPEAQRPDLAWRAHRAVMALEGASPPDRAPLDDLALRFHLHVLVFELSDTEHVRGPPFYGGVGGRPVNLHLLRAAQLLRLVPALARAGLAPHYLEQVERALALVDGGGPFADGALVLELLRPPYVWKDSPEGR